MNGGSMIMSIFFPSFLAGISICAPIPPPLEQEQRIQAPSVTYPLKRDIGYCNLRQQWWTEEYLISGFREYEKTESDEQLVVQKCSHWLMRENRKKGDIQYLQTPDLTDLVTSRDGSIWAFSIPSYQVNTHNGTTSRKGEQKGRIFQSDDFKSWRQVGSIMLPERGWIGLMEILDGNRFLLYGRFAETQLKNEYVIAEMDEKGILRIQKILRTSGLMEPIRNLPYCTDVSRTKDHIVHASSQQGWNFIFNAHTGEFERFVRCYEFPKEDQPIQFSSTRDKVLLSMRPTPGGDFILAVRSLYFVLPKNQPAAPSMKMTRPGELELHMGAESNDPEFQKHKFDIVWRSLDAGTGEMKDLGTPTGGMHQLKSSKDVDTFSLCFGPEGMLRTIQQATAQK